MFEDLSKEILSNITVHMKYAKFLQEKNRRENWEEIVSRNELMHIKKFPDLKEEILEAYKFVYSKKILPSMRSIQFAGKPIELNNTRIYNCSFLPVDSPIAFSEIMFLLLSGCGVGYSVQNLHINKLPYITKPTKTRRYLVGDSIEGWADAVKMLIKAYFNGKALPDFDYNDVRPKGSQLVTAGGKAPGPEPLKDCLHNMKKILDRKENGEFLTSLEIHDMICYIADAVLSGGIRRAAMVALFDIDDENMLTCKFGDWYIENPQRGRANNSAVIVRHMIEEEVFFNLWKKIKASGSGEPGFFFTNDPNLGSNPCMEISLLAFQFCNLVTINFGNVKDQKDLNERARAAAFIATLQASYTNFHYLRDIWKRTTEKEALIGVSMTGVASGNLDQLNLKETSLIVKNENIRVANIIGIKPAARRNTIKPEGTSSLVLGTSSGVHAWHSNFYIRRIRVGKNESIYSYLKNNHPEIVEDEYFKPNQQAVISIPQRAPEFAITRENETALELLNRVSYFYNNWIVPGHSKGANKNNISTTVTIKPNEWEEVGQWMWKNKNNFTALSVLPFSDHSYIQAPFENISEQEYNEKVKHLHNINLDDIMENNDNTVLSENLACAGGGCEI